MRSTIFLTCLLLFAGIGPVLADELTLSSGKTVTGTVTETKDGYQVELPGGSLIQFKSDEVISVEFSPPIAQQYASKAQAIAEKDAAGHFQLARWCSRNGLQDEMQAQLQAVIVADPDHEQARRALGFEKFRDRWMTMDEAMKSKGFVEYEGSWITTTERDWLESLTSATLEDKELQGLLDGKNPGDPQNLELIRKKLVAVSEEEQMTAYRMGLAHKDPAFRAFCAKELGRFKTEENFDTLVDTALLDTKRDVRVAAVKGIQRISEASNVSAEHPFVSALLDERAAVRIAAAEALNFVGSSGAMDTLLTVYRMTWGQGSRNHIAILRQYAYIEDYDVQVATAAAVADPVIGVVQEGMVLDARPLRTERTIQVLERRILRETISKISGDEGILRARSMEEMNEWWHENKEKYRVK